MSFPNPSDVMAVGYVVVNENHPEGRIVCNEDCVVYRDRVDAERDASRLRRRYRNPDIRVYEITSPGVVYVLSEEDVFEIGRQNRIGKRRLRERMDEIQKGIESGFYDWSNVVETAIDLAMDDR